MVGQQFQTRRFCRAADRRSHRACGLKLLNTAITGGPDNRNNRFAVADEINQRFGGIGGPFWGRPGSQVFAHLPTRKFDYPS